MMDDLEPGQYLLEIDREDGKGFVEWYIGSIIECKNAYYRSWKGYAARVMNRYGQIIMEAEAIPEDREDKTEQTGK